MPKQFELATLLGLSPAESLFCCQRRGGACSRRLNCKTLWHNSNNIQAFLQEEGGTRSVTEGDRTRKLQLLALLRSPSVSYADSSLPEGAPIPWQNANTIRRCYSISARILSTNTSNRNNSIVGEDTILPNLTKYSHIVSRPCRSYSISARIIPTALFTRNIVGRGFTPAET